MSSIIFSEQYGIPCVVPIPGESAQDVIDRCEKEGAVYTGEGEEDYCVQLRPDVGPEIYSKSALMRSIRGQPA